MSDFVLCPECRRKLKVPETMGGKSFRCPGCKAIISAASLAHLREDDSEDGEQDTPSSSRPVQTTPSAGPGPASSRSRPPQEDEPDEEIEPEQERPLREKPSRKRRPIRKGSSRGLIIGLAAGCGVLMLLMMGGAGGLIWHFARNSSRAILASEWQAFTPPNGECSVFMPGTPQFQPLTIMGLTINKYQLTRHKEKAFFIVAFVNLGPDPLQPNALDAVVNGERDHIMHTLNGKLANETPIALGNLPGREFQVAVVPHGMLIERIYLAKVGNLHRVYIMAAAGDNMTPNDKDADRFFNSFKIAGSAMPPTFLDAAAPQGRAQQPPANQPQPNAPRKQPRMPRRPG